MFNRQTLNSHSATLEHPLLIGISLLLGLNTLLFIAPQVTSLTLLQFTDKQGDNTPFYIGFTFLGIALLGTLAYYSTLRAWRTLLRSLLIALFPAWIVLTYGLNKSNNFHFIFRIAESAYMLLVGFFLASLYLASFHSTQSQPETPHDRNWFQTQGAAILLILFVSTLLFFSFGFVRLTQFAAVDEPLWYNGRIGKYWHRIASHEWNKTAISDKPGITIALASGPGLWFENAKDYKFIKVEEQNGQPNTDRIERFYRAFRLPLLITITLLLPLFYFFLERLFGIPTALYSYAFLTTSPVLIGISKIINPDALLWIFTPLSLLSILLFSQKRLARYLILSGVFLGFALLTKYVANILFVFFFGLIFIEYLYHRNSAIPFSTFLKHALAEFALLTYTALATFYVFFPAVWVKPGKLFSSTLGSQAFAKIAPLFLALLGFVLIDHFANNARVVTATLQVISRFKRLFAFIVGGCFVGCIIAVLGISWNAMSPYAFPDLLASPKTIDGKSDFIGIFLTNFYPLVFGVSPLILFLVLGTPLFFLKQSFSTHVRARSLLIFMLFILLFYLGATVNGVAMIVRYQIILFPLIIIMAGIALAELTERLALSYPSQKRYITPSVLVLPLLLMGIWTLSRTPFPLSYVSSLLPKPFITNVKDMGSGSYEVAQYLNSLPDAKNILIWTDKDGVCKFFIGHCKRGRNYLNLRREGLDYIIVSSDRKNRTTKMMSSEISHAVPGLIRFDQYYLKASPAYSLSINGRSNQYIRAYRFEE